jgi:hypothetical protein
LLHRAQRNSVAALPPRGHCTFLCVTIVNSQRAKSGANKGKEKGAWARQEHISVRYTIALVRLPPIAPCDKLGGASCKLVHTFKTAILVFVSVRSLLFATYGIGLRTASTKGCVTMLDLMVYGVLILGFPLGVLVGYRWRDRISHKRRAQYLVERGKARIT